jgi:arylsulfatase A-like enzyme
LGETEEFWPDYQGFEINKGGWSKGGPTGKKGDTTGGYFTPYGNPRLPDGPPGEYITDRLAEECIRYIENIGAEPFMMVYSLYAVHNPMQAPTELVKKYERKRLSLPNQGENVFVKDEPWMKFENGWRRRAVQDLPVYAAMVENMDTNIGHIVAKLKEKGLYENTLIIFTSDNGGLSTAEGSPTVNGPLRAGKGWLYEGGIRVPFIMHWNGKIAANTTREVPVTVADIFPTVAKVMDNNYQTDPTLDGKNIFEWMAKPAKFNNRTLYWHYPHYSNQGGKPGAAIREGKWKLIYNYEDASVELYDLVTDVGERTDLSTQHKKRTDRLNKKLMHWLKDRNAKAPVRNMEYREEKKP